jgi:hypothetical protein
MSGNGGLVLLTLRRFKAMPDAIANRWNTARSLKLLLRFMRSSGRLAAQSPRFPAVGCSGLLGSQAQDQLFYACLYFVRQINAAKIDQMNWSLQHFSS